MILYSIYSVLIDILSSSISMWRSDCFCLSFNYNNNNRDNSLVLSRAAFNSMIRSSGIVYKNDNDDSIIVKH